MKHAKRKNRNWLLAAGLGAATLAATLWTNRRGTYDLSRRVVLITGGSRGLGLVLARQAIAEGARVAICARDEAELERARQDLLQDGAPEADVMTLARDVTDAVDVRTMVAEVENKLGSIDVLINNAGIITAGPLDNMDLRDFEDSMAIHFWAPLHAMQAVLPGMRHRGAGRIINISSLGGKVAVPHMAPYSASKFALVGLSEGFRAELRPQGIYVTTVCPGLMRTGSARQALVKGDHKKEYAWFSIADALPGLTMSAEQAARQIWNACRRGDGEVILRCRPSSYQLFTACCPAPPPTS
jgi:NAD(P)-dependent dehydrogenase (short-subunit alcohol dehydrogenase family)